MKKALILAGIAWDDTWQRHQQVAAALVANGYEVTFIERIPSSAFTFRKVTSKLKQRFCSRRSIDVSNGITEGINVLCFSFLPPGNFVSDLMNRRLVRDKVLPVIDSHYDLVFNYLPIKTTKYIYSELSTVNLVYDCVRAFDVWGGYPKSLASDEQRLFEVADHILVDSYYLYDKACNLAKPEKVTQVLPTVNKADYELCLECYTEIERINSIAYFGSVDEHIDLDALYKVADAGIDVNIFGKIYGESSFIDHPNITFHGYFTKSSEMFTAILNSSDAVIIPYHGKMDGVIPAKLMQSLATLRPVFISSFYDSEKLSDYMFVYSVHDELIQSIKSFNYSDFASSKLPLIRKFIELNFAESLATKVTPLNILTG